MTTPHVVATYFALRRCMPFLPPHRAWSLAMESSEAPF